MGDREEQASKLPLDWKSIPEHVQGFVILESYIGYPIIPVTRVLRAVVRVEDTFVIKTLEQVGIHKAPVGELGEVDPGGVGNHIYWRPGIDLLAAWDAWKGISPEYKFRATDSNGGRHIFEAKPAKQDGWWACRSGQFQSLPVCWDWENSLRERPSEKNSGEELALHDRVQDLEMEVKRLRRELAAEKHKATLRAIDAAWRDFSPEWKWRARNQDGVWRIYQGQPFPDLLSNVWIGSPSMTILDFPPSDEHWAQSLRRREDEVGRK